MPGDVQDERGTSRKQKAPWFTTGGICYDRNSKAMRGMWLRSKQPADFLFRIVK